MLEWFLQLIQKFAGSIVKVLPLSPFQPYKYLDQLSNLDYLGYLNWFLPVGSCVKIGVAWLGAIAAFYLYSIILRWIKAIGG